MAKSLTITDDGTEYIELEEGEQEEEILQEGDLMTEEKREELVRFLTEERETALSEWATRNEKLRRYRTNLEAIAKSHAKNYPFRNSSNLVVPVTQMVTQTIYAKTKGSLAARDPFWTIDALRESEGKGDDVERAKILTKYFGILAKGRYDLNLEEVLTSSALTTTLEGTCIHKVVWATEHWNFKSLDEETGVLENKESFIKDGPEVVPIPLDQFLYRRGVTDLRRAKWVSHEFSLEKWELEERKARGIYKNVDDLLEYSAQGRTFDTEREEHQAKIERADNTAGNPGLYDISEFSVYFDVDDDGLYEELIITMHCDSGTVLKEQTNTLGFRFFVGAVHIPRAFSVTGRGTGQLTEGAQYEATEVHNIRVDNMKIANMRIIVAGHNADFGPREEIYPGMIIRSPEPKNDVTSFQLGEIYPSSESSEMIAIDYAQRASGVNDTMMGFANQTLKSRDTARGQALRIQAGDSLLSDIQKAQVKAWSDIGLLIYLQLVSRKDDVIRNEQLAQRLSQEEIQKLEDALSIPIEEVPKRLSFTVEVTNAEQTFETMRQNTLTLTQLFSQYAQQVQPLVSMLFGPQGQQMLQQAPKMYEHMMRVYTGSTKLIADVFEFFGKKDWKNYVPDWNESEKMLEMIKEMKEQMSAMGQVQGQAGPPPAQQGQGGPTAGPPPQQGGMM